MSKEKKKFFDCKSKVFIVLFVVALGINFLSLSLDVVLIGLASVVLNLLGFALMIRCVYKDIKSKEYSLGKKVLVWIWDVIWTIILINIVIMLANKAFHGYMLTKGKLSCDLPIVKNNVEISVEDILVKNNLISQEDFSLTFQNFEELKYSKNRESQDIECRALVDINKTVLSVDYNASYSKRGLSLMITDMREK